MKTRVTIRKIAVGLSFAVLASRLLNLAAAATNGDPSPARLGPEHAVALEGQPTGNSIYARELVRVSATGRTNTMLVLYDSNRHSALAALSTYNVFYLKGKLFSILPLNQGFLIREAQPFPQAGLTAETASIIHSNTLSRRSGDGLLSKRVDLKPILKSETEKHLAMAMLRSAKATVEDGRIVVNFVSFVGFEGKVTLDDDLNPVSMFLVSEKERPPPSPER
jgi:hypothetical protein